MSWIWLCHVFNDGRFTTSHERNKRIRWTEDYAMCVKEKNTREEEIGYVKSHIQGITYSISNNDISS